MGLGWCGEHVWWSLYGCIGDVTLLGSAGWLHQILEMSMFNSLLTLNKEKNKEVNLVSRECEVSKHLMALAHQSNVFRFQLQRILNSHLNI